MEYSYHNLLPVLSINRIYTAFEQSYGGQFIFYGESHIMWELDCVLEGRVGITSGGEVYDCEEGDLVIHPADTFHSAWAQEGGAFRVLTVTFTGSGTERYIPAGKFILNETERTLIEILRVEIASAFHGALPADIPLRRENSQIIAGLLETLCLSLYRRRGETAAPASARRAALFSEIVAYLEDGTDRALTVGDICAAFGVGQTTLKELFRAYTGMGVMKYYNHLRVRRAVSLLSEGYAVARVAERMGFSSQNYFSAFFRRETGRPPSRYMREEAADAEGG